MHGEWCMNISLFNLSICNESSLHSKHLGHKIIKCLGYGNWVDGLFSPRSSKLPKCLCESGHGEEREPGCIQWEKVRLTLPVGKIRASAPLWEAVLGKEAGIQWRRGREDQWCVLPSNTHGHTVYSRIIIDVEHLLIPSFSPELSNTNSWKNL